VDVVQYFFTINVSNNFLSVQKSIPSLITDDCYMYLFREKVPYDLRLIDVFSQYKTVKDILLIVNELNINLCIFYNIYFLHERLFCFLFFVKSYVSHFM